MCVCVCLCVYVSSCLIFAPYWQNGNDDLILATAPAHYTQSHTPNSQSLTRMELLMEAGDTSRTANALDDSLSVALTRALLSVCIQMPVYVKVNK